MRITALLVLAMAACATPGTELMRQPGDFAFLEVTLEG
jgi:hypothetical protein